MIDLLEDFGTTGRSEEAVGNIRKVRKTSLHTLYTNYKFTSRQDFHNKIVYLH